MATLLKDVRELRGLITRLDEIDRLLEMLRELDDLQSRMIGNFIGSEIIERVSPERAARIRDILRADLAEKRSLTIDALAKHGYSEAA